MNFQAVNKSYTRQFIVKCLTYFKEKETSTIILITDDFRYLIINAISLLLSLIYFQK